MGVPRTRVVWRLLVGTLLGIVAVAWLLRESRTPPLPSEPGPVLQAGLESDEDGRASASAVGREAAVVSGAAAARANDSASDQLARGLRTAASLTGRVVDSDGAPIAEARIALRPIGSVAWPAGVLARLARPFAPRAEALARTTSDRVGGFEFAELHPRVVRIHVAHPRFARFVSGPFTLTGQGQHFVASLGPGVRLSGVVRAEDDRDLLGAQLVAQRLDPDSGNVFEPEEIVATEIRQGGRYELDGLVAYGRYRLGVRTSQPPDLLTSRGVRLHGRDRQQHLLLLSPAEVTGIVRDRKTGAVLAGAQVEIASGRLSSPRNQHPPSEYLSLEAVQTDEQGRFRGHGLPNGMITIRAALDGYIAARTSWPSPRRRAPDARIEILLERAGRVEGTVRSAADGRVVAGATVTALQVLDPGSAHAIYERAQATTDENGHYRLEGLVPGPLHVMARSATQTSSAWLGNRRPVVVEEARTITVDLQLTGTATLVGRVEDRQGRPLPGARVRLDPRPTHGTDPISQRLLATGLSTPPATTTDGEGRYRFEGLHPGMWQASVGAPGHARRGHVLPQLYEGETQRFDWTLAVASGMEGVLTDSEGGAVAGATLRFAYAPGVARDGGPRTGYRAQSDEQGKFRFPDLSPGSGTLTVAHPHHATLTQSQIELVEGRTLVVRELQLRPARAVTGVVRGARGKAVAGATVIAHPIRTPALADASLLRESVARGWRAQSDARGHFRIEGLPQGPVQVLVWSAPGHRAWSGERTTAARAELAVEGSSDLEFRLDAAD